MLETKLELIVKDENTTKTFTLQRPKNDLNQRQNSSSVTSVVIECESLEDTKDWIEKIREIQSKLKWPSFWWSQFPSSTVLPENFFLRAPVGILARANLKFEGAKLEILSAIHNHPIFMPFLDFLEQKIEPFLRFF